MTIYKIIETTGIYINTVIEFLLGNIAIPITSGNNTSFWAVLVAIFAGGLFVGFIRDILNGGKS